MMIRVALDDCSGHDAFVGPANAGGGSQGRVGRSLEISQMVLTRSPPPVVTLQLLDGSA
jgi:hypothetical protein